MTKQDAFIVEGPVTTFLVATKADGEKIAIDVTAVNAVEQRGNQVILHWMQGETPCTCRLQAEVVALTQLLCSCAAPPSVDFAALAQTAFSR